MSNEEMFFNFLKEYRDEPNAPDYSGEYPQPYELTQEDAELILNVIEKKDKEIERLNNKIHDISETLNETYNDRTELRNENKRLDNIINELEKEINSQLTMTRRLDKYNEGYFDATLNYYNKLKELKGDGSNGN